MTHKESPGLYPINDLTEYGLHRGDFSGYLSKPGADLLGLPTENGQIWELVGTDDFGREITRADYREYRGPGNETGMFVIDTEWYERMRVLAQEQGMGFVRFTETFSDELLQFIHTGENAGAYSMPLENQGVL